MDKALLLHGWGSNSRDEWFPWLKKELTRKLFDVYVPNLPNTKTPDIKSQAEYIDIYASDFREWWLIVGHSLWGKLTLNFVQENNVENSVIVLVWPVYTGLAEEVGEEELKENYWVLKKYFDAEIDFEKINKLNNKYIVFLSDNDPYINLESAKKYYQAIKNVEIVEFKNKWHFNTRAGVSQLPEILDYIK